MKTQKTLLASLMSLMFASTVTYAQTPTSPQQQNAEDTTEIIEVTGIRGSIINARNEKLLSEGIVDAYFAEDIGKSSDENITEALQRLPGVTIERGGQNGDQGTVVVRGIQPALNLIKFNGVTLTSNTDSQAVDLTAFSADILSSIIVAKSVRAKDEEGSLGGTIFLNSAAPLSRKDDKAVLSIESRYNDLADEVTPRLSFSFNKRISDKFAFGGSLFWDDNEARIDSFETSLRTGDPIRKAPLDAATLDEDPKKVLANRRGSGHPFQSWRTTQRDTRKEGGTLSFQWLPQEDLDVRLDMAYSKQSNTFMYFDERAGQSVNGQAIEPPSTAAINLQTGRVDEYYGRRTHNVFVREVDGDTDNYVLGLNATKTWQDWVFKGRLAYSGTDQFTRSANISSSGKQSAAAEGTFGEGNGFCGHRFEQGDGDLYLPVYSNCPNYTPLNPNNLFVTGFQRGDRDVNDDLYGLYFDVSRAFYDGPIAAVHMGVKATKRNKDRYDANIFTPLRVLGAQGFFDAALLSPVNIATRGDGIAFEDLPQDAFVKSPGKILDGIAPAGAGGAFISPTPTTLSNFLFPNGIDPNLFDRDPSRAFEIEEDTQAAYVQVDYSFLDDMITGDFGLRYVRTEVTGQSAGSFQFNESAIQPNGQPYPQLYPVANFEESHDYTEILPSLNVRVELMDDLLLRFSAGRSMARPELSDLAPNFTINARNRAEQPTGRGGNTLLDPFIAEQYDLSLEWYFDHQSVLSATVFHKKMDSFVFTSVDERNFANPLTGEPCMVNSANLEEEERLTATVASAGCTDVVYTTNVNGAEAEITGVELGYTQIYDFLPGVLQYLGTSINYTYADSEAQLDEDENALRNGFPFPTTSENSVNSVLFWDNKTLSLRLAYTYRDESIVNPDTFNHVAIRDARGVLNFSANYRFNENLMAVFSVANITDTYDYVYLSRYNSPDPEQLPIQIKAGDDLGGVDKSNPGRVNHLGRNYRLSLRYTF